MKRFAAIVLLSLVFSSASALAEEKLGVRVYGGASFDASTTKFLKDSMSIEAFCYRTGDPIKKVVDFYKGQPGLKLLHSDDEGALFRKGTDIDVTVQNPWMNMKTGELMKDTLISIVRSMRDEDLDEEFEEEEEEE